MTVVLDSSALLAAFWSEPGSDVVDKLLNDAVISTVNWAEIVAKLQDRGIDLEAAKLALDELPVRVVPFEKDQAFSAGAMRKQTKHLGLSIGDRACLSLAEQLGIPVYTADRSWVNLELGITVNLIR